MCPAWRPIGGGGTERVPGQDSRALVEVLNGVSGDHAARALVQIDRCAEEVTNRGTRLSIRGTPTALDLDHRDRRWRRQRPSESFESLVDCRVRHAPLSRCTSGFALDCVHIHADPLAEFARVERVEQTSRRVEGYAAAAERLAGKCCAHALVDRESCAHFEFHAVHEPRVIHAQEAAAYPGLELFLGGGLREAVQLVADRSVETAFVLLPLVGPQTVERAAE